MTLNAICNNFASLSFSSAGSQQRFRPKAFLVHATGTVDYRQSTIGRTQESIHLSAARISVNMGSAISRCSRSRSGSHPKASWTRSRCLLILLNYSEHTFALSLIFYGEENAKLSPNFPPSEGKLFR